MSTQDELDRLRQLPRSPDRRDEYKKAQQAAEVKHLRRELWERAVIAAVRANSAGICLQTADRIVDEWQTRFFPDDAGSPREPEWKDFSGDRCPDLEEHVWKRFPPDQPDRLAQGVRIRRCARCGAMQAKRAEGEIG